MSVAATSEMLSLPRACELLGRTREQVIELIETGRLAAERTPTPTGKGRHYRIARRDIIAWQIRELEWQLRATSEDAALPERLTVSEAARALGRSRRTVYNLIERGDLRALDVPRRRIPREEIAAFRERNREGAAQTA